MKDISKNRYKTVPHIKKEFVDLLYWDRHKMFVVNTTKEELEKRVDEYFEEKDIALYGEIRKIHGANTRNPITDLLIPIIGLCVAIIFMLIIINI